LALLLSAGLATAGEKEKTVAEPMYATLKTSAGVIVIRLFDDKAPKTVENFVSLATGAKEWTDPTTGAKVKRSLYNGTIFHRVIPGFMIQGGGFEPGLNQKSAGSPITNEADNGLKNQAGTIAMARTSDPHSATAQFFINTADNDFLNHKARNAQGWGYAVFGKVVEGMDVVRKIEAVATHNVGPHGDVPVQDVVIEKIEPN
jgi:cyclophilin family peptidyl-prolyl cis-trans isomerase